jgi:hypothetical protein
MKMKIVSKENITSGCYEPFVLPNYTMTKREDHP